MSWPYVAATWHLRLDPILKLVLLALADQADMRGTVGASRQTLERLTGLGRSTVKRSLRALGAKDVHLVEALRPAGQGLSKEYRLHIPGVRSGVQSGPGSRTAPGSTEVRGGGHSEPTPSPVQIPRSIKAEAARPPRSTRHRHEEPTADQVTKLAHVLMDDPAVQITEGGDLVELMKRACAQAGFLYDTAVVDNGIKRALAARGIDPTNYLTANLQNARRRVR